MDFFRKLSDPVYFSKFSNRTMVVFSILSILFCCYIVYLGYYYTKPGLYSVSFMLLMMSLGNLIRSSKRLKKLS